MQSKRFRILIAVLALLAFSSQSLAVVTISCNHQPDETSTAPVMAGMDHSVHTHEIDAVSATDSDCCLDASCIMSDCISSGFAVSHAVSSMSVPFSRAFDPERSISYLAKDLASPFRPPIFR